MDFARNRCFQFCPVILILLMAGCSSGEPKWAATNKKVIDEAKVT
jgi:hypothetical protein